MRWPWKRCQHHWVEVRRHSREPATKIKFGGGFIGQEVHDALYGWTMIELKCEHCGDVKTRKTHYAGSQ